MTPDSSKRFLSRPDHADVSIRPRQRETYNCTTAARDEPRWASNTHGTVLSRIDIQRTVAPGQRYTTVPDVRSGGESLLCRSGWPRVEKPLRTIEAVEAPGIDPADVAPEYGTMSTIGCPSVNDHNPGKDAIAPGDDASR
jgi:hypothetical protein